MDADPGCRGGLSAIARACSRSSVALAVAAATLIGACTTVPTTGPEPAAAAIEPIPMPVVTRLVTPPPRPAAPAAGPMTLGAPAAPIVLLIASDLPAYVDVASRLESLLGADRVHSVVLDEHPDAAALAAQINAASPRATVAIGLDAALFAAERTTPPVVFCQVLNFSEHESLLQTAAGVSALPSIAQQFRYWKNVDPALRRIGVIAGPGHEALLAEAERAASEQNLDFEHRISQSAQETIYIFKRLAARIDGFWLVPDNRILSLSAIREILSYATEKQIRVVVSSPSLLKFGAVMSFSLSPAQIADAVYDIVEALPAERQPVFEIFTPTRFDVAVNPRAAAALGLELD